MPEQTSIDALAGKSVPDQTLWIDGKSVGTRHKIDVVSPIDGQRLCDLAEADEADVDAAVAAARKSFEAGVWSRVAPAVRKKKLLKLADLIERDALELAVLGVRDNGTEISMALKAEPFSAAGTFRFYAEAVDKINDEITPTDPSILAMVVREPLGVIGAIVPWNFPMMIGAWKIAPALAAGNSVVLKPAEGASLTLNRLGALAAEAGIPDGVLNIVTGRGHVTGKAMGLHMDIDALAFTGSGPVGRLLMQYAAQSNLKRVYLELGGKSPNIVFDDVADVEKAAKVSANGIFRNSGQVCVAGSRLLLHNQIADEFIERLLVHTRAMKVGHPLDLTTQIGAVSSSDQLNKNLAAVTNGQAEGARLICGGERLEPVAGGNYMSPTIFDQVRPDMNLAREEVFGPVLSVLRFEDEAEAVRIANDTEYGLASAVWTQNISRAHRMVRAVRAGVVHVNTYGGSDITVPLGGFKQSGFGRDKSMHAMGKYTDLKSAWIAL